MFNENLLWQDENLNKQKNRGKSLHSGVIFSIRTGVIIDLVILWKFPFYSGSSVLDTQSIKESYICFLQEKYSKDASSN